MRATNSPPTPRHDRRSAGDFGALAVSPTVSGTGRYGWRAFFGLGSTWWEWVLLLLGACGWVRAEVPVDPTVALFEGPVQQFEIVLTRESVGLLTRAGGRSEVTAEVRVGTNRYAGVRLHLKGSGSFRPVRYRPSFTLKFSSTNECFGLRKLHLNNSVHDPTRLAEVIGSTLHLQAGVPTTRATPVLVSLNGRELGVYVLKEGFDKRFLKRHFQDTSGNLYDPGWGEDINSDLAVDAGPASRGDGAGRGPVSMADGHKGLERLFRAATLAPARRLEALDKVLDVDRFVTMMGLQILTDDWDGYVRHRNNYRLYDDPKSGRMVFFPHGMDFLLGSPRSRIFWPEFHGIVAVGMFSSPGFPDRLRKRIDELEHSVFTETNLLAIVDRVANRLDAALVDRSAPERTFHQEQIGILRGRIHERVATALEGMPGPVKLELGQAMPLSGWKRWAETFDTELEERKRDDGKPVLRIAAHSGATCASWRTRLVLGPGNYRFEGTVSIEGVRLYENARDPGVGLRVVPARRGVGLSGTESDQRLVHQFRVRGTNEVMFVAEFSGHSGSAEFLRDSLRVVRVTEPE